MKFHYIVTNQNTSFLTHKIATKSCNIVKTKPITTKILIRYCLVIHRLYIYIRCEKIHNSKHTLLNEYQNTHACLQQKNDKKSKRPTALISRDPAPSGLDDRRNFSAATNHLDEVNTLRRRRRVSFVWRQMWTREGAFAADAQLICGPHRD